MGHLSKWTSLALHLDRYVSEGFPKQHVMFVRLLNIPASTAIYFLKKFKLYLSRSSISYKQ